MIDILIPLNHGSIEHDSDLMLNDELLYQFDEDEPYYSINSSYHQNNNGSYYIDLFNSIIKPDNNSYNHDDTMNAFDETNTTEYVTYNSGDSKSNFSSPPTYLNYNDNSDHHGNYYTNNNGEYNYDLAQSDNETSAVNSFDYKYLIHTQPKHLFNQSSVLNEKCIYEEFLNDYNEVSSRTDLPQNKPYSAEPDIPIYLIKNDRLTKNKKDASEIPLEEKPRTKDSNIYIPRCLPDVLHDPPMIQYNYHNTSHMKSVNYFPTVDYIEQKFSKKREDNNFRNSIKTSSESEFVNTLQKKLCRYVSSEDYFDKLRFQEISYRFSKTYL